MGSPFVVFEVRPDRFPIELRISFAEDKAMCMPSPKSYILAYGVGEMKIVGECPQQVWVLYAFGYNLKNGGRDGIRTHGTLLYACFPRMYVNQWINSNIGDLMRLRREKVAKVLYKIDLDLS